MQAWWREDDIERWVAARRPRLRREDVAARIGMTYPHFRTCVREERFHLVPTSDGRDAEGLYWEPQTVDEWLSSRPSASAAE